MLHITYHSDVLVIVSQQQLTDPPIVTRKNLQKSYVLKSQYISLIPSPSKVAVTKTMICSFALSLDFPRIK